MDYRDMMNNLNSTFLSEKECECGETVELFKTQIVGGPRKGEWQIFKRGCRCNEIQMAQESLKQRERLKAKKQMQYFEKYSLINPALQRATLQNFEATTNEQQEAKNEAVQFIKNFSRKKPQNEFFYGLPGSGKSHLSKSITDEVMKQGFSTIFISIPKLLRKFKGTYKNDSELSENDLYDILASVDLLVLDDVLSENESGWTKERLFDLLDERQGRSTIYTSNYGPDEVFQRMGVRDGSRLINQDTSIVEVKGPNYRIKDLMGQ